MQEYHIEYLFFETNALKLLRDKRAPLILSFLKTVFAQDQKSISQKEMERRLTDYLRRFDQNEISDENEILEPGADLFDWHQQKAKSFLRDWEDSKKRYLKGDNNSEGQYEYFLTEHVVRAWQWIESLEKKEFTGTRSRLNDIFEKLNRVVEHGREKTDEERIEALQAKKRLIDQEIEQINAGKSPYKPLNKVELTEEYDGLMEQIRALSADFKSVEGRFERIRTDILKRQALSDETKGKLLHQALDARDDLDSTPQGQSFNSFFEILRDPQRQQLFTQRVEELLSLLQLHGIVPENDAQLRRLYRHLLQEAQPVLEANRRIADRIRRFIGEQNRQRRQLLRQRISEAKAALLNPTVQKQFRPQEEIWDIDNDRAFVALPLEKALRTEPDTQLERFALPSPSDALAPEIVLHDDGAIGLKVQTYLAESLSKHPKISLKALAETHGIEEGISEVLAYLNLLSASQQHQVDAEQNDIFLLEQAGQIFLSGPQVEFLQPKS